VSSARTLKRGAMIAALVLAAVGFVALGVWQLERRVWKHALIATVEARIHAPEQAPPGPADWATVNATDNGYSRVRVVGRYRANSDVRVRAVSDLGAGYWVMTPLDTGRFVLLVNRGFVPQGAMAAPPPATRVTVTGLLRLSEPGGAFLRSNDPAAGRWYSRDVAAIARSHGLTSVAPYFIDADRRPDRDYPIGGLTVVRFPDNHLAYALTWFALAGLSLFGLWRGVLRAGAKPANGL